MSRQKAENRKQRTRGTVAPGASRGFTLVEMIVSIALFAVVMVVAVGALLSLTAANKKAQALQSVMNNLNVSLDSMVRNIRMGKKYHCGSGTWTGSAGDNCSSSGNEITFTCNPDNATCARSGGTWAYGFNVPDQTCPANTLCRSTAGGAAGSWTAITAPEVIIEDVRFYVVGAQPGNADQTQPKVVIVVKGQVGSAAKEQSTFHIQATAVQREIDL